MRFINTIANVLCFWHILLISCHAQTTRPIAIKYDPNSTLSADDAEHLVTWGIQLLDLEKNAASRLKAAEKIGLHVPHKAAIPFLRKVVEDTSDDEHVRANALVALSRIPDPSVIPIIIKRVSDQSAVVRGSAVGQLRKLANIPQPDHARLNHAKVTDSEIGRASEYWKEWWRKAEDGYVFDRARMLWIE